MTVVLGRDRVLRLGTTGLDRHNSYARMTTAQQRARLYFWALCCDRVLRVTTWFPGQLGGLGRNKGSLCRERDFLALCRYRNSMLRSGLGLGQVWVATRVSWCRNRVFQGVGHSCRDRRLYVATRFPKGSVVTGCLFIPTHRPAHTIGRWARTTSLGCALDRSSRAHSVRYRCDGTVQLHTALFGLLFFGTVHEHYAWALFTWVSQIWFFIQWDQKKKIMNPGNWGATAWYQSLVTRITRTYWAWV